VKLTEPQRRALSYLATVADASPARIGEAMYHDGWLRLEQNLSAQGCGRVGGTMATRLVKMGLVRDVSLKNGGWPAYAISPEGRKALKSN
jgi:hypothetical protein